MPIAVISTPLAPTPPSAADSGSDATAQDFANLLHGQLTTNAAQRVAAAQTDLATAALPISETAPTDATPTDAASLLAALGLATTPTEAAPTDPAHADKAPAETAPGDAPVDAAASVLAALGLAATPAVTSEQSTAKSDPKADDSLTSVSGTAGQNLKSEGNTEALKTAPAPTSAAAGDDKAAIFAATLATAELAAGTKTDSADTTTDGIASLPNNVSANATNHLPTQHSSSLSVHTPVRDQSWAADLGQKIVWLASNDKQSAQLTLNPPQMGPIEISLNVDKGNASVSFASANAEVRDAIETALPRLREMFASAGIELGQTNVGAESFSQRQQQTGNGEQSQSSSRGIGDNAILAAGTTGALRASAFAAQQGNGMVDIFA